MNCLLKDKTKLKANLRPISPFSSRNQTVEKPPPPPTSPKESRNKMSADIYPTHAKNLFRLFFVYFNTHLIKK